MTDKERELIGKGLIEDSTIKDVIDYFGAGEILDKIDDNDIVDRINSLILLRVDDDELIDAINDTGKMLDSIPMGQIEEYVTDKGYEMTDILESDDVLKKIGKICRELQPHGYIDKEVAKKLLCDYLDFWMDRSF